MDLVTARRALCLLVGLVVLASCRLPADARFQCEADRTCAQPGFVCGADGLCHPPGELDADGGVDAGAAGLCGNVACFHFDEGDGGVTADATGRNVGTLQNRPRWIAGRIGSALLFNGTDTYVDIGNNAPLRMTGSMTLCAWIYPTGAPYDDAAIISSLVGGTGYAGYQLDTTIDLRPVRRIGFKLTDTSGNLMIRYGDTAVTENTWHHVAGVYDAPNATLTVYLDGAVDEGELRGPVATTQGTSTVGVTIGSRSGAPGAYNFKGRIDEAMIFDRALSAQEIGELYRAAP